MSSRIRKILITGQYIKALYIYFMLVKRSQSFNNLSLIMIPCSKELERIIDLQLIKERNPINILVSFLDNILGQLETIFICWIVLLYAGSSAKATYGIPIPELELPNYDNLKLFITITIIVFSILCFWNSKVPEIIVEGPMSQQEYSKLQDVLAYQAWLDNLALSPIGKLWELPF